MVATSLSKPPRATRTSITARHTFLTFAGMFFYGWWNPWFVLLMLGTTALDYNLGRMIVNAERLREKGGTEADVEKRKKLGVVLSVTSNLAGSPPCGKRTRDRRDLAVRARQG